MGITSLSSTNTVVSATKQLTDTGNSATLTSTSPIKNKDSKLVEDFRNAINSNLNFQFHSKDDKEKILKKLQDRHLLSYQDKNLALDLANLPDDVWQKVLEQGLLTSKNPDDKIRLNELISYHSPEGLAASFTLEGKEYEHANEVLHGKMPQKIKEMLASFTKKHPDIKLSMNNNVSEQKAKEIIQATEEYAEKRKNSGIHYAKQIRFGDMTMLGMCAHKDKMFIGTNQDFDNMRITLAHENGHAKDMEDGGFNTQKTIPADVKPILNKMLKEYATRFGDTTNTEAISVLAEAIETPDDIDRNPLTKQLHVRKDDKGNYILMLPKEGCGVTKEELEKVGAFYRDIKCPAMIPDFDEAKHGKLEKYNETILRYAGL